MIKKSILLFAACASFVTVSYGQKCATDEVFQEARKVDIKVDQLQKVLDDAWRTSFNNSLSAASSVSKTTGGSIDPWAGYPASRAHKVIIPVVVHIIHEYGSEYIPDNSVFAMIKELNERYNAQNADLADVIDPFKPIIGNSNIEFRLAQKDPVGNPTIGITRKKSYLTRGGDEQAKFDLWAPNRYLNIWLVRVIGRGTNGGTVLAYATPPASGAANPYGDGVISIASEATGGIAGKSTIAHETGHYLNLAHPWNSSGRDAGVACGDDDVDDTPPTKGHFGASGNCDNMYYLYDTNCANLSSPIAGGFEDVYTDSVTYLGKKIYFANTPSWSSLNSYMANRDTSSTLQMSMQQGTSSPLFGSVPSIAPYIVLVTDSIKKPNGMRPGRIVNGLIDTLGNPKAGLPYTLRTKKLVGMYKYQANGSDQGFASVALTKWNSGTSKRDTIAFVENNFTPSSTWKYFSFNLAYNANTSKPDSAIIVLSASSKNNGVWAKGSTLQLDHVMLTDGEDGFFITTTAGDTADYADIANTQNIMDYANCEINFTKQQVMRMRAALNNNVGNRNNLVTPSNWAITGIGDTAASTYKRNDLKPVPDFSVEKGITAYGTYYMCGDAGHSFVFKNQSWRDTVTSVAWSFSNGATPATSTSTASASVNFYTPGWATISLKAVGNNSGDSTIERKAVYVANPNYVINPMNGYFQEFTDATENDKWPIFNYYDNEFKWELSNTVGYYDHSCIVFKGFDTRTYPTGLIGAPAVFATATNSKAGDIDDFYTPAFDLTGMASNQNCNLNFMFAGAWRTNASSLMNDTLELSYSTDCGTSWPKLKDLTKADLVYGTYANAFVPISMNDWYEQNIPIPVAARQSKVMFRFRYKPNSDGSTLLDLGVGNNYYVDRINVSPFATSVKGLHSKSMNISLAPNPTRTNTTVLISNNLNNKASVTVTDMTGKIVYQTQKVLTSTMDSIEIPETAITVKGFYMVQVVAGTETITEKLVSY